MTTPTDPAAVELLAALHASVVALYRLHGLEPPPVPPPPKANKVAVAVLRVLEASPLPLRGKQLATAAGLKPGSHFREVVAALKREGKVAKVKGGYRAAPPT